MSKKDLQSVTTNLAELAWALPTQNLQQVPPAQSKAQAPAEEVVQFSFGLRKSLRKELARLAEQAQWLKGVDEFIAEPVPEAVRPENLPAGWSEDGEHLNSQETLDPRRPPRATPRQEDTIGYSSTANVPPAASASPQPISSPDAA